MSGTVVISKNSRLFIFICSLFFSAFTAAELKPMSDEGLSDITGQAYVSIDKTYHPTETDVSYTRVNLGMDIETNMKADVMELGKYEREGEAAGSADLLIENFGLGYIHSKDYARKHPYVPMMLKDDGTEYAEGELVPFSIKDPFIEFAHDENTNEVIGVRIGFGETKGILSGTMKSLTGNIDVDIRDYGAGIKAASSEQGNVLDKLLIAITPLLVKDGPLEAQAKLVDSDGNLDEIRSSNIGIPNGEDFTIHEADIIAALAVKGLSSVDLISSGVEIERTSWFGCGIIPVMPCYDMMIESKDCLMLGVQTCFPLSDFKSLPVGKVEKINGKNVITDSVNGMFLSFQSRDMDWSTSKAGAAATLADYIPTTQGAFFNVPNGAIEVNLNEVYKGVPSVRLEYIDRGVGLF